MRKQAEIISHQRNACTRLHELPFYYKNKNPLKVEAMLQSCQRTVLIGRKTDDGRKWSFPSEENLAIFIGKQRVFFCFILIKNALLLKACRCCDHQRRKKDAISVLPDEGFSCCGTVHWRDTIVRVQLRLLVKVFF